MLDTLPMFTLDTVASPTGRVDNDDQLQLVLRQAELANLVARLAPRDGEYVTNVPDLALVRVSEPYQAVHTLQRPALCMAVRGAKHLMLADELYAYDASNYLVVAQHLPVMCQVVQASQQEPYLGLRLYLDPVELSQQALAKAGSTQLKAPNFSERGLVVGAAHVGLLNAVLRLVYLSETPEDIPVLAPLAVQEIVYRLLAGKEGPCIAQLSHEGSQARRIAFAIEWLRERYTQPLQIQDLANVAHMSASSLHHHFKAVTAMSPLQYQKRLRLYEARKLLLSGVADAATAGHRVGYESPSQFSREYSRLFGSPPARDLREMRERRLQLGLA
jgi:AraC-like DNA-binding protein